MSFLDNLPCFFSNKIDAKIQDSLYLEAETLHNETDNTLDQFFVESCTWGLDYWEHMLGIGKNNFDIQTRRENIKAKMRSRGTSTIKVIKNICESYANGEVEVIENNSDYSFIIKFVGSVGIPSAFEELDRVINEIKPCHLAHTYKFKYTTHKELEPYTHAQLAQYTHEEIRNGALKGVSPMPPEEIDNAPVVGNIESINTFTNEEFSITYTASDDKGIVKHEFFDGESWLNKEPSNINNSYTINHIFTSANTKQCKIRVTDTKGQTAVSNAFDIVVTDRPIVDHPPSVSQDIPSQEGVLEDVFTISYVTKDDKAITKHEVFNGSNWLTKTATSNGNNHSVTIQFTKKGVKNCQIRVTDSKGQTAVSNKFTITVNEKVVAPPPVNITIRHIDDVLNVEEGWYGLTYYVTSDTEIKSHHLSYNDGATWEDFSPSDYAGGKFGYIYATKELQICKIKVIDINGNEKLSNSFKLQASPGGV